MFWKGFQYHYNTAIIIINLYQITYVSTFISFTVSSFFSLPLCNLIKEGKDKSTRFNIIGKRHSGRYQTKLMTLANVMGHVQSSATTTAAWLEMTVGNWHSLEWTHQIFTLKENDDWQGVWEVWTDDMKWEVSSPPSTSQYQSWSDSLDFVTCQSPFSV